MIELNSDSHLILNVNGLKRSIRYVEVVALILNRVVSEGLIDKTTLSEELKLRVLTI